MKASSTAKAVLIGASPSELLGLGDAARVLDDFGVGHDEKLFSEIADAKSKAYAVAVLAVGTNPAPALMLARKTQLPVIAVPLTETALYALNAAATHSKVSPALGMVAIGGAHNAGLLAVQMVAGAARDDRVRDRLLNRMRAYKQSLRRMVLAKVIKKP